MRLTGEIIEPLTMIERVAQRNMAHTLHADTVRTHLHAAFAALARRDPIPSPGEADVERWLVLLLEWNARMDLTAARTEAELVDLMVADALVLAARIPQGARVVDVGSGAGAPGLPLALVRPDLVVTLVEPLTKRIAFLRTVIGTLGRTDVRLERGRGETTRGAWDVAISRATLAPPEWVALGGRMVEAGGSVWVLLARDEPPVVSGLEAAEETSYAWPCTGATRRAVRYVRA